MSFETHLPRRVFLKGLGTTMALPLLDAMNLPRALGGETPAEEPVRMAFIFFPNGAIMPAWKPQDAGEKYELSETLKPLEPFKADFNVLTGLAQDNGRSKGDGPGDHARSASSYLTGAHPYKTDGAHIRAGVSVDQAAAKRVGYRTRLPSLELGIERGRNAGNCDSGYSCAYSSNISWRTPNTPTAKEINPRLVFERMFGSADGNEKQRKARDLYRKSILDLVADDARRLKQQLGQTDRQKIDEYFTSVRELELRIDRAQKTAQQTAPKFDVPPGVPRDLAEHVRLMYDLLLLAFQTDTTRIATFMVANAGSNKSYPMAGVKEGWHSLSHHRGDEDKINQLKKIDKYLIGEFAYFLERLKTTTEGQRTLLDNCMIMYGSGLSDGNRHWHHDLPVILAGRGGGTIQTGRHIACEQETPLNNLFLSLLDRMGTDIKQIGDSSGRLKELDA